jgi:membrane protease YdiL (CAAX protease family)
VLPGIIEELVFRGIMLRTMLGSGSLPLAVLASSALFGLGHLGSDMTAENALFVFLYTFVGGSMHGLAYLRTGSLYAAILAHIIANTAASLSLAVPPEAMSWVNLALVELCCLGCLPLLFAASRRVRLALIVRSTP